MASRGIGGPAEAMIKVVFFASLREAVSSSEQHHNASSLRELMAALQQSLPEEALSALNAENVRVAVNQGLVEELDGVALKEGDEVAFLPPVTGG